MASTTLSAELRGAVLLDQLQPQFAATIASSSEGFYPIAGEAACWVEVCPGIVVHALLDVALKACEVRPGAMVTERSYGVLEVHGPDLGLVRMARDLMLGELGARVADGLAPKVLTSRTIHRIDDHQAMVINRDRAGMLVLGKDTLYILEVTPAVFALAAAVRLVDLQNHGAVGRLQLAGTDADIEQAVAAVERTLAAFEGREHAGEGR